MNGQACFFIDNLFVLPKILFSLTPINEWIPPMKKVFLFCLLFISTLSLSACGTLFSSSRKTVNITTNTKESVNAQVLNIEGEQNVRIPSAVIVKRSSEDLVINVKDNKCYEDSTTRSPRKLNKWVALNIFFGLSGFTGTSTDAASGTLWDYEDDIMVNVEKKQNCNL